MAGEIEIRDKLDFSKPKNKWRWILVSDLMNALGLKHIGSIQIGKVLNKLMKQDKRIESRRSNGYRKYLLPPIQDAFDTILGEPDKPTLEK